MNTLTINSEVINYQGELKIICSHDKIDMSFDMINPGDNIDTWLLHNDSGHSVAIDECQLFMIGRLSRWGYATSAGVKVEFRLTKHRRDRAAQLIKEQNDTIDQLLIKIEELKNG